ncbi:MAG: HpcH/HpaI aldolase family protein, partial [Planctomycetota bacterium]
AQAERVVRHARYAPLGERGVCRFVRNASYGAAGTIDYFKQANTALVIAQLEGREALENLDDILAVEGIDVIFIGPYDLSQSLGVPGEVEHPQVQETMAHIANEANRCGKVGELLCRDTGTGGAVAGPGHPLPLHLRRRLALPGHLCEIGQPADR